MLKTDTSKSKIELLPGDTVTYMTTYLPLSDAHFFAKSSKDFNQLSLKYQKDKGQALKELFQAIIDDDQETVKKILDEYPWLLLEKPGKNQTLKSKYTHQTFNLEGFTGLQIALLRDQMYMTKLILSYFGKIKFEQNSKTNGVTEAFKQWKACEGIKEEKQERIKGYLSKMKTLIEDITQGTFDVIDFRNGLLPKNKAIDLKNYVDVEALLVAAYQAYNKYFDTLFDDNWYLRDQFAIKVIGFLQSLVSPETAKVFCEGLRYVVEEGKKPGDIANSLTLATLTPLDYPLAYYRTEAHPTNNLRWQLGFEFLVGQSGRNVFGRGGGANGTGEGKQYGQTVQEKFYQSKMREFCQLRSDLKAGRLPTLESETIKQNSCSIQ